MDCRTFSGVRNRGTEETGGEHGTGNMGTGNMRSPRFSQKDQPHFPGAPLTLRARLRQSRMESFGSESYGSPTAGPPALSFVGVSRQLEARNQRPARPCDP